MRWYHVPIPEFTGDAESPPCRACKANITDVMFFPEDRYSREATSKVSMLVGVKMEDLQICLAGVFICAKCKRKIDRLEKKKVKTIA